MKTKETQSSGSLQRRVMPPFYNPNPRIGVLLKHNRASMRTKTVMWRFHMRGLVWLKKNWPEERMRRELRGYGPKVSWEWNGIVAKRHNDQAEPRGQRHK